MSLALAGHGDIPVDEALDALAALKVRQAQGAWSRLGPVAGEAGRQLGDRFHKACSRFFDQYRSYVINYNLGKDMARTYIESRGGTADKPVKRWEEFEKLLTHMALHGEKDGHVLMTTADAVLEDPLPAGIAFCTACGHVGACG